MTQAHHDAARSLGVDPIPCCAEGRDGFLSMCSCPEIAPASPKRPTAGHL